MDKKTLFSLEIGDLIRQVYTGSHSYIVTGNYGGRATAVRTVDITNESEWELVRKANGSLQEEPDFNIKAPDIAWASDLPKVPKPKGPINRCFRISLSSAGICSKCQSTVERRFIYFGQKRCINPECGEFS